MTEDEVLQEVVRAENCLANLVHHYVAIGKGKWPPMSKEHSLVAASRTNMRTLIDLLTKEVE